MKLEVAVVPVAGGDRWFVQEVTTRLAAGLEGRDLCN